MTEIFYDVHIKNLHAHLVEVKCTIKKPNKTGQVFSMAAWVPGSYLIRDFAKHIVTLNALDEQGNHIALQQCSKSSWCAAPCVGALIIEYQVYCLDITPRGAWVDQLGVFFDSSRIFLQIHGAEEKVAEIKFFYPNIQFKNWQLYTTLHTEKKLEQGFGVYISNNYWELIDHPVAMGDYDCLEFTVDKINHSIIMMGQGVTDQEKLIKDIKAICEHHVDFFGQMPDIEKYIFFLKITESGYGGIEHRASSALQCARRDLCQNTPEYEMLLGLFSHEYFHTWQVKRILPEVFVKPDLQKPVLTEQLWIFEGITSYYDDFSLLRAQLLSMDNYLKLVSKTIDRVLQNPGASVQTAAQSSVQAWSKFYQPNENSPNAVVSYYTKGALIALCLDIELLDLSAGKINLQKIMRLLWQRYGKLESGLPERAFETLVCEAINQDLSHWFDMAVRSTKALPMKEQLAKIGIDYSLLKVNDLLSWGGRAQNASTDVILQNVFSNTALEHAGFAPYDRLVAIDNIRVTTANIGYLLSSCSVGQKVLIHAFRNDQLYTFVLTTPEPQPLKSHLQVIAKDDLTPTQRALQTAWLAS